SATERKSRSSFATTTTALPFLAAASSLLPAGRIASGFPALIPGSSNSSARCSPFIVQYAAIRCRWASSPKPLSACSSLETRMYRRRSFMAPRLVRRRQDEGENGRELQANCGGNRHVGTGLVLRLRCRYQCRDSGTQKLRPRPNDFSGRAIDSSTVQLPF